MGVVLSSKWHWSSDTTEDPWLLVLSSHIPNLEVNRWLWTRRQLVFCSSESAPLLIFCALAAVQWSVEMVVLLGALPPRSRVQRAEKSHKTSSGLCSLPPPSAPPQSAQPGPRAQGAIVIQPLTAQLSRWGWGECLRVCFEGLDQRSKKAMWPSCPHRKKDGHFWSSSNLR